MRRKDREMDATFACMVVDQCKYAVLATVNANGTPYCVPISIVRENTILYFHCATEGQKVTNMQLQPYVCVTCIGSTHIIQEEFTTRYESAVLTGIAQEVTVEGEKIHALQLLCRRYTPDNLDAVSAAIAKSLHRTAIWKITIESITGKCKK